MWSHPRTRYFLSSHWDAFPINHAVTPPMLGSSHHHRSAWLIAHQPRGPSMVLYYKEASVRRHTLYTTPTFRHPQPCTITPTTMPHLVDGEPANFEVHFLYSDNPRDGFCVMGVDPLVHYEFRTPLGFLSTYTIVRCEILPPLFFFSSPSPLRIRPFFLKRAADG